MGVTRLTYDSAHLRLTKQEVGMRRVMAVTGSTWVTGVTWVMGVTGVTGGITGEGEKMSP